MVKDKEKSSLKAVADAVKSKSKTSEKALTKETPAKSKPKGFKSKETVSSSEGEGEDSESESESESELESASSASSASNSDSGSDSGSDLASDSESSSSELGFSSGPTEKSIKQKLSPPPSAPSESLPPTYSLPPNSTPLSTTTLTSTNPFLPKNLHRKQLFLITAPSHIPPSTLHNHRLPFSSLTTGDPFLTHASHRYGLRSDEDDTPTGLILLTPLPGTKDGHYGVSSVPITKSLHLTIVPPAPLAVLTGNIQPKAVRTQPEGLQMRYHPFGAGPSIPGENQFGGVDGEGVGQVIREVSRSGAGDVEIGGMENGDSSRKRRKTDTGEGKRKKKNQGEKSEKKHKDKKSKTDS
ncbi:DNA-directed RNA polymerase I subunit RPA34.5-domain-containing protein [Terfezia claveryi]|nr:DNA-directed RNA polymerase I subunit RPA34.5-domain-containing protein [Terfezia claveryi]